MGYWKWLASRIRDLAKSLFVRAFIEMVIGASAFGAAIVTLNNNLYNLYAILESLGFLALSFLFISHAWYLFETMDDC